MSPQLLSEGSPVRVLTLNRPEKHNALSEALFADLVAGFRAAEEDSSVRCVILKATGKNFCAGGDLEDFLASHRASLEDGYGAIDEGMELFKMAFSFKKPVIVAVRGACRGGGVGLSALGHLTIAAPSATFALTELKLGLFPYGIFPLLTKNMGEKRSLELALTTRMFSAAEALDYQLISEIADEPEARAMEVALSIARASAYSVSSGLELYNAIAKPNPDTVFSHGGLLRLLAFKSGELAERVGGFLEGASSGEELRQPTSE